MLDELMKLETDFNVSIFHSKVSNIFVLMMNAIMFQDITTLLKDKNAFDKLVSITVTIDVRDDLIYYSAVSGVSSKLRTELKALGEAIESLEIYDGAVAAPIGK